MNFEQMLSSVRAAESAYQTSRAATFATTIAQTKRSTGLRSIRRTDPGYRKLAPESEEEEEAAADAMIASRRMRVFVSSTFTDMSEEREVVAKSVSPAVEEVARSLGVSFATVDLRWGISQQDTMSGTAIEKCLAEVLSSSPFFVAILGERYGWSDDSLFQTSLATAASSFPWVVNYPTASVTELEIIAGALGNPHRAYGRAFFFFKANTPGSDPSFVQRDLVRARARHDDPTVRLIKLKERIRASGLPVAIYSNVDHLGSLMEHSLVHSLLSNFAHSPSSSSSSGTPAPNDDDTTGLLGPDGNASKTIAKHLHATTLPSSSSPSEPGKRILAILGPSGVGKSVALRVALDTFVTHAPQDAVLILNAAVSDGATNLELLQTLLTRAVTAAPDILGDFPFPQSLGQARRDFGKWVSYLAQAGKGVAIIIDGGKPCVADVMGDILMGLSPPERVGIVITTRTLDDVPLLARHSASLQTLTMGAWSPEQVVAYAVSVLESVGKKLTPSQRAALASSPGASLPVFTKVLVDELSVYGDFDTLDDYIDRLASLSRVEDLLASVFSRWASDFEDGSRIPRGAISKLLALLATTSLGLRPDELADLIGVSSKIAWRRLLRVVASVVQRKKNGRIRLADSRVVNHGVKEYVSSQDASWAVTTLVDWGLACLADPSLRARSDGICVAIAREEILRLATSGDTLVRNATDAVRAVILDIDLLMGLYDPHSGGVSDILMAGFRVLYGADLKGLEDGLEGGVEGYLANSGGRVSREMYARAMVSMGLLLKEIGMVKGARRMLTSAVDAVSRALGAMHELTGEVLIALGEVKGGEDGVADVERGEGVLSRAVGPSDPRRGMAACTRGFLLKKAGQYAQAREAYESGLTILAHGLGPDHPVFVREALHTGDVYRKLALWDDARHMYSNVLDSAIRNFGRNHLSVAEAHMALGTIAKKQGLYDLALERYTQARETITSLVGRSSILMGDIEFAAGDVYRKLGRYADAMDAYKAARAIRVDALGSSHVDVGEVDVAVGRVLKKTGQYDDAEAAYRSGLASYTAGYGKGANHPRIASVLHLLGDVARKQRDLDKAYAFYQRALDMNTALDLQDEVGWNVNGLGLVSLGTGEYDAAETYLSQAYDVFLEVFGAEHVKIAAVLNNQGILAKVRGDYERATSLYEASMAINKAKLGRDHIEVGENLANLAVVAAASGDIRKARQLLGYAIGIAERVFGVASASVKVDVWSTRVDEAATP